MGADRLRETRTHDLCHVSSCRTPVIPIRKVRLRQAGVALCPLAVGSVLLGLCVQRNWDFRELHHATPDQDKLIVSRINTEKSNHLVALKKKIRPL